MINSSLLMIICLILLQLVIGNDTNQLERKRHFCLCSQKQKTKIKIFSFTIYFIIIKYHFYQKRIYVKGRS